MKTRRYAIVGVIIVLALTISILSCITIIFHRDSTALAMGGNEEMALLALTEKNADGATIILSTRITRARTGVDVTVRMRTTLDTSANRWTLGHGPIDSSGQSVTRARSSTTVHGVTVLTFRGIPLSSTTVGTGIASNVTKWVNHDSSRMHAMLGMLSYHRDGRTDSVFIGRDWPMVTTRIVRRERIAVTIAALTVTSIIVMMIITVTEYDDHEVDRS